MMEGYVMSPGPERHVITPPLFIYFLGGGVNKFYLVTAQILVVVNKLITMENPTPKPAKEIDWITCILCQVVTKEKLTSPTPVGYKTLAEKMMQFHELDSMPIKIDISSIDHGNGIEATLQTKHAKWHKSCSLKFSTTQLVRVKERKRKSVEGQEGISKRRQNSTDTTDTTDAIIPEDKESQICFLCSESKTKEKLHKVCTLLLDLRVRRVAYDLQDEKLMTFLSTGDLISLEAKYHLRCLANLYNKARKITTKDKDKDTSLASDDQTCTGIALAELIFYIEERREEGKVKVFKLADLTKLYKKRLEQLGIDVTRVNSTRLKDQILLYIPDMNPYSEGRDVFLTYSDDVAMVLRQGYEPSRDEISIMMTKIAHTIRKDIFSQNDTLSESFDQNSQVDALPKSLLSLVSMLINGPNITEQTRDQSLSQPVLNTSQQLALNSIIRLQDQGILTEHASVTLEHLPAEDLVVNDADDVVEFYLDPLSSSRPSADPSYPDFGPTFSNLRELEEEELIENKVSAEERTFSLIQC
ncbi:hypothetical protein GQR58_002434 [Nymphon striatum]|nr:hypothetical protein GQR58_002434 [Nymphon striatum]